MQLACIILRGDKEESFFIYGIDSKRSSVSYSVAKERIPNAFVSTCLKEHYHEIMNGRWHNEESSSLFLFLPSITDRKEKINQFRYKVNCSSNAHVPKKVYPDSAGYDLWAANAKVLKPWSRELIRLDLSIAIPEWYYGRIVGRSGLANTHGISVHNGTIDMDYRGIVFVVLFNLFNEK